MKEIPRIGAKVEDWAARDLLKQKLEEVREGDGCLIILDNGKIYSHSAANMTNASVVYAMRILEHKLFSIST